MEIRVQPQNLQAEQSVIGAMLISRNAIDEVGQILRADDFYRETHRKVFQSITDLNDAGMPVDMITLVNELKKSGDLEKVGGISGLAGLVEKTPTAANVEYYADIVKECSLKRRIIAELSRHVSDLYSDGPGVLAKNIQDQLFDFCSTGYGLETSDFKCDLMTLLTDVHDRIYDARDGKRSTYIPSGYDSFDAKFQGWQRGGLTVLLAPPKEGKSMLMVNSLDRTASIYNTKSADIILDMTRYDIINRMLARRMGTTVRSIYEDFDPKKITAELGKISGLPIKICGVGNVGRDAKRILRWISFAKKNYGTELFFVDSFSKIDIQAERGKTDESYISWIVDTFQSTAQQLDVAIVGTVDKAVAGNAKGSSRWLYGPDAIFDLELNAGEDILKISSKYVRNHARADVEFHANYAHAEIGEMR
jgi:replicative DNA helicase